LDLFHTYEGAEKYGVIKETDRENWVYLSFQVFFEGSVGVAITPSNQLHMPSVSSKPNISC